MAASGLMSGRIAWLRMLKGHQFAGELMKVEEFWVRFDGIASDGPTVTAARDNVERLFQGFSDGLEQRATSVHDGLGAARETMESLCAGIQARLRGRGWTATQANEIDGVLLALAHLEALAMKEQAKWRHRPRGARGGAAPGQSRRV